MNGKAAKLLRVMATKPDGTIDKALHRKLKKKHKSIPWNMRYVRG